MSGRLARFLPKAKTRESPAQSMCWFTGDGEQHEKATIFATILCFTHVMTLWASASA